MKKIVLSLVLVVLGSLSIFAQSYCTPITISGTVNPIDAESFVLIRREASNILVRNLDTGETSIGTLNNFGNYSVQISSCGHWVVKPYVGKQVFTNSVVVFTPGDRIYTDLKIDETLNFDMEVFFYY